MSLKFLSCVCCTWLRPFQLFNMIKCFESFDYPKDKCELIVLDDAGQYQNRYSGVNWEIISINRRFHSLGEKRNALASLIDTKSDAYVIMDDDDVYLPWHLTAINDGLQKYEWCNPDHVWEEISSEEGLKLVSSSSGYHAAWGYSTDIFQKLGKYPNLNRGEDITLRDRYFSTGGTRYNTTRCYPPSFIRRWHGSGDEHISGKGTWNSFFEKKKKMEYQWSIDIKFSRDWLSLFKSQSTSLTEIWKEKFQKYDTN